MQELEALPNSYKECFGETTGLKEVFGREEAWPGAQRLLLRLLQRFWQSPL